MTGETRPPWSISNGTSSGFRESPRNATLGLSLFTAPYGGYMEGLATTIEVAEYLKVKPGTLDVWAHRGMGPPFIRVESARRYDWQDVRDWLEARKVRHG